ncbi:MAG: hypothetical protein ACM3JC_02360 [Rudaea sp.]
MKLFCIGNGVRALLATLACLVAAAAFAQAPTQRIRGDVVSVEGTQLALRTRSGQQLAITLDDRYVVNVIRPIEASAIAKGRFVGTATLPQRDGTQRALEVVVFPESARGSGEGHYPWDLAPGSMMTNATVAEVVGLDQARRMTLKYPGGEQVVVVPPNAPIVTFEPGTREMLRPGAHVFLVATVQPDGSLKTSRVSVGKDGLVPPM